MLKVSGSYPQNFWKQAGEKVKRARYILPLIIDYP